MDSVLNLHDSFSRKIIIHELRRHNLNVSLAVEKLQQISLGLNSPISCDSSDTSKDHDYAQNSNCESKSESKSETKILDCWPIDKILSKAHKYLELKDKDAAFVFKKAIIKFTL